MYTCWSLQHSSSLHPSSWRYRDQMNINIQRYRLPDTDRQLWIKQIDNGTSHLFIHSY
jgi:hypothetical protein